MHATSPSPQENLVTILKQKGTGKTMSKSLSPEQCLQAETLLHSSETSHTTKVTLLTAFIMLENTAEETTWFQSIQKRHLQLLPKECHFLFYSSPSSEGLLPLIHKVLNHQDLNHHETQHAVTLCLNPKIPETHKAVLLEGLRLKEESELENKCVLNALQSRVHPLVVKTPFLIDIASAYDGFNRHPNLILALAPLLASVGIPVILHGCHDVSPKFGITFHKCLKQSNKDPFLSQKSVAKCIETPSIGWGYIDQSIYAPELYQLRECRTHMVKRPVLATVEKFLFPLVSENHTYCVTGYTHPGYRDKTRTLLHSCKTIHNFMLTRGIEGSSFAPFDRRCPIISSFNEDHFSSPETYAFNRSEAIAPNPGITLNETLACIHLSLCKNESIESQWLMYNALLIIDTLNLSDVTQISLNTYREKLHAAITSGSAWSHWLSY